MALEVEESVLGGVLLDLEALPRIIDTLTPDMFALPAHAHIYRAAIALHASQQTTDLLSVMSYLSDKGLLSAVGGQSKLLQLVERTVSAVNIDQYAKIVRDKYLRRTLIKKGHELVELAYNYDLPFPDLLDKAEKGLYELRDSAPTKKGARHIGDVVKDVIDLLERESQGEETEISSIPTQFPSLDNGVLPGGLPRGCLVTVLGGGGTGKTSFALELGLRAASSGHSCIAFSLEMQDHQYTRRAIARVSANTTTPINSNLLFAPRQLNSDHWEAIASSIGAASNLPFWIDDNPNPSLQYVHSQIRSLTQDRSIPPLGIVIVDYTQLMHVPGCATRATELDILLKEFRIMAKTYNCVVLALAQVNKGVHSREDKRPTLSDARESGAFEHESALMFGLYNPPETNDMECIVLKNRYGTNNITVPLRIDFKYGRFLETRPTLQRKY